VYEIWVFVFAVNDPKLSMSRTGDVLARKM